MMIRCAVGSLITIGFIACTSLAAEQTVPSYLELKLESVYPAGGQRGTTVPVLFGGYAAGLTDARDIVIDGPPGITVQEVKNKSINEVEAQFVIAPDAPLGRRCVRVRNNRTGLTNMMYFVVGRHPEQMEQEPNNDPLKGNELSLPIVVNGRINPAADVDCYRFQARAGQKLTLLVSAHALDSHGQYIDYGFVDAELAVLDDAGRVLAEAQDSLGLDPLVEFTPPADGTYTARVQHVQFRGYPQAVYRLTIGELAVPTSVFPPGGRRGEEIEVTVAGPNVPPGTKVRTKIGSDLFPQQWITVDGPSFADADVPIVRSDSPELTEQEPNDTAELATAVELGQIANGRFDQTGDVDWYRIKLTKGQQVLFETTAHRYLHAPADTMVELFDSSGKKLGENDDGFALDYMSIHDFQTPDSLFHNFAAPADGDYLLKVTEQTGSGGPRAVYRLSARAAVPDFNLEMFPDGVPVWGPGSSAGFVVRINREYGLDSDIELSIEGLPTGWTGSSVTVQTAAPGKPPSNFYVYYGARAFLTVTAPPDAPVGAMTTLRVVGKTTHNGRALERIAQPLTLYYSSDIGFFRVAPVARAIVCTPRWSWLSAPGVSLSGKAGDVLEIPLVVHEQEKKEEGVNLVINLATAGVACALNPPGVVPIREGKTSVTLKIPAELPPGPYGITVARSWQSDIRAGMPAPSTPLIPLRVLP